MIICMISTKHSAEMVEIRKRIVCHKPMVVVHYNRGKCTVNLYIEKTTTLHHIEKTSSGILLNTSTSNAMILYKQATETKIKVSDFRMVLAMHLTQCHLPETSNILVRQRLRHEMQKKFTWHQNFAESAIKKMLNSQDQKLLRIGSKRWPPIVQIVSMSHIYV